MKTYADVKSIFVHKMYIRAFNNNQDTADSDFIWARWNLRAVMLANRYFAIFGR